MKKLYFVRHGQTDANAAHLWAGHLDAKLTADGKAGAIAAGKELKAKQHPHIDLIICSPLQRAYDTACLIAVELDYPVESIEKNPLFIERSFGAIEGHSIDEFFENGKTYKDIDAVKEAESIADVQHRAQKALEYVNSLPYENILVVGHGASGRALRRVVGGEPHTNEYIGELKIINNSQIVQLL